MTDWTPTQSDWVSHDARNAVRLLHEIAAYRKAGVDLYAEKLRELEADLVATSIALPERQRLEVVSLLWRRAHHERGLA